MLTYDVYVGNNKKGSVTGASGANVTYTAGGLTRYTNYEYYVVAKDPLEESIQSSKATVRTYCPGNVTCSNGKYCDDYEWHSETCEKCEGTGSLGNNCPGPHGDTIDHGATECQVCGYDEAHIYSYTCSYSNTTTKYTHCPKCVKSFFEWRYCECTGCSGVGSYIVITKKCKHGYGGHYYCNLHGDNVNGSRHTIYCPHYSYTQHDQ